MLEQFCNKNCIANGDEVIYKENKGKALRGLVEFKQHSNAATEQISQFERRNAAKEDRPYKGHVGHVPDTTWTGKAQPHSWLDLDAIVNSSIGGQANGYPEGYQATEFIFKEI